MTSTRKTLKSFSRASWFCEPFCPCPTPLEFQWRETGQISVVSSSGNYACFALFRKGGRAGDNWIFFGPVQKFFKKNRRKAGPLVQGRKIFQALNAPGSENYRWSMSIRPGAFPCLTRSLPLPRAWIAVRFAASCPCPTPLSTARPHPHPPTHAIQQLYPAILELSPAIPLRDTPDGAGSCDIPGSSPRYPCYPGVIPSRYRHGTPTREPTPAIYSESTRHTSALPR